MRKFFIFLIVAITTTSIAMAQDANKLSITTQLFLEELKGNTNFERKVSPPSSKRTKFIKGVSDHQPVKRIYAAPETVDGVVYIAAYVRVSDKSAYSELESLGVEIQNTFKNGTLLTTRIPVDRIEKVASIKAVTSINVSPLVQPLTDVARTNTNADDVLSYSDDARAAGLPNAYDGSGVLLGVLDTGIDFQHIAFKDKNGNYRLKRAYVYTGNGTGTEYSSFSNLTTDNSSADHGTHTCSTAGGSSVIFSGNHGSTVTVTDNHANATYGGMAPNADLYLAGLSSLVSTELSNAVSKVVNYAESTGQPVVVSNSWGSQWGPHDGTGDDADVYNDLFGEGHPNRIALFAASNDAGISKDGEGGGYHIKGTASSSNPLQTIIRSAAYINTDGGSFYSGILANAWARSTNVSQLSCKVMVVNINTGQVLKTTTVTPTTSGTKVDLGNYYSGTLYAVKDYTANYISETATYNKTQLALVATSELQSSSISTTNNNGSTYYVSDYTLAVEFYPSTGSSIIDVWGGTNPCYFTNQVNSSGYNWQAGSDDMCVSDQATIGSVISIGAHITKNTHVDYNGNSQTDSDFATIGDIAYFSSYATATESPTGLQYPWITAPGARLIAGVNHNNTSSSGSGYINGSNKTDRVNANTTYPYAAMQGTSMATPTAAGIVALWLQAANTTEGKQNYPNGLTVNDVKNIMKETAIHDSFTDTGANASHFGNGKIDALAGIQYILASPNPCIIATPSELTFNDTYVTQSTSKTFTVKGKCLEGNINVSLTNNPNDVFSISSNSVSTSEAINGKNITVTFTPSEAREYIGTITLTSQNAETVTISLSGKGKLIVPELIADPESLSFSIDVNSSETKNFEVLGANLEGPVTLKLNDNNEVFTIDKTTLTKDEAEEGVTINVTFNALYAGTFTGNITLTSPNCEDIAIVNLNATASDGGTASDAYLDITKYATIDKAGWNVSLVDKLYEYKEYDSDEVAWLTLPVYGAFVGAKYSTTSTTISSGHPQAWIETSVTASNQCAEATWSATDVYLGSNNYFTSATAKTVGTNSQNSQTEKAVTFYVTKTTAVKLYAYQRSKSTTYPTTLKIYECTVNGETLTPGTATIKDGSLTTSGTGSISLTGLDETKIYKVVASQARGYLYEIGFQTPLPQEVTLAQIVNDPSVVAGKQYRIVDDNLIGAYLTNDEKSIYCKDDNGFTNKKEMTTGQTDFMTEHGWQTTSWDQSNWIMLKLPAGTELTDVPTGHLLSGVRGTLINKVNPTLQLTKVPTPGEQATVNFNTYLATDFDPEMLALTENYFFLPAKPMEVAKVMWAMWDAASGKFVVASPVNNSTGRIDGAFYADLTKYYNDPSHPIGEIKDGYVYNFTGFAAVNVNGVSASTLKGISTLADETPGMVVYPLANWELKGDSNIITAINGVYSDGYREVVGVEYVNAAGLTSDKPFKGVNIVVTRYSDGSRTTLKKLYR